MKVIAQEKVSEQTEIIPKRINLLELLITKNTTDNEIKEFCKQLKKMYNIDLSFFNIKRNSNNEIISIEGKDKDIHGSGSYIQSNNTPIKPFKFFYDDTKKEMGYFDMDLNSLSKGKEIIINGKVSTQDDLNKLNLDEIKAVALNTKTDKPTIEIDTKNTFKPVKITDKDIYIDGVKSTNDEFSKLDQNSIDKIDVDTFENTVRITTKTIHQSEDNIDFPTPPTPPSPPAFTFKTPKPPVFPKAPKAPKGDPINGDKKAWKDFENKMEDFNKKMAAMEPQMKAFEKKMEEFDKQMEPFNTEMEAFDKKMKIYEQQMEEYQSKMNAKKGK